MVLHGFLVVSVTKKLIIIITNSAHVEAFMAKPEFVDVFCRADSRPS